MGRNRDRLEKLRRLAQSPNIHEATRAQEAAERLAAELPPAPPVRRGAAFPHQLPGAFRIPTPLGRSR